MSSIPSLANPPKAPMKKDKVRPYKLHRVRDLILSPSIPAAPKKVGKKKKNFDLSPIPLEWDMITGDGKWLADSGHVREKFLTYGPDDVRRETDRDFLTFIRELYFPASQPLNIHECAYLALMRDAIQSRLSQL